MAKRSRSLGQTQGLKGQLIIDHKAHNLELLVFYRKSKSEYPGAGFRDVGRFEYVSHTGSHPTSFRLERIDRILETSQHDLEALLAEDERVHRREPHPDLSESL